MIQSISCCPSCIAPTMFQPHLTEAQRQAVISSICAETLRTLAVECVRGGDAAGLRSIRRSGVFPAVAMLTGGERAHAVLGSRLDPLLDALGGLFCLQREEAVGFEVPTTIHQPSGWFEGIRRAVVVPAEMGQVASEILEDYIATLEHNGIAEILTCGSFAQVLASLAAVCVALDDGDRLGRLVKMWPQVLTEEVDGDIVNQVAKIRAITPLGLMMRLGRVQLFRTYMTPQVVDQDLGTELYFDGLSSVKAYSMLFMRTDEPVNVQIMLHTLQCLRERACSPDASPQDRQHWKSSLNSLTELVCTGHNPQVSAIAREHLSEIFKGSGAPGHLVNALESGQCELADFLIGECIDWNQWDEQLQQMSQAPPEAQESDFTRRWGVLPGDPDPDAPKVQWIPHDHPLMGALLLDRDRGADAAVLKVLQAMQERGKLEPALDRLTRVPLHQGQPVAFELVRGGMARSLCFLLDHGLPLDLTEQGGATLAQVAAKAGGAEVAHLLASYAARQEAMAVIGEAGLAKNDRSGVRP